MFLIKILQRNSNIKQFVGYNRDKQPDSIAMSRSRSSSFSRKKTPLLASPSRNSRLHSRNRSGSIDGKARHRDRSRNRSQTPSRRHKSKYSKSRSRSVSFEKRRNNRRRSYSRSPYNDRRRPENPQKSRCLGVFGLNVHTTRETIIKIFEKYGSIERVQVVVDAKSGRSRGYCFVYFDRTEDAKVAKEQCSGMELDSRIIRVDYSITQRPHTPTPGVYMGRPTRWNRDYDRSSYRGDDDYYRNDRRSRDRRSPSPYYSRERRRRYDRSRSHSYSPRDRRYR